MDIKYLMIIPVLMTGILIGNMSAPGDRYYLNKSIFFEKDSCHETSRIEDGKITSVSWFADSANGKLYFANFDAGNHPCAEFYKMFGIKEMP